MYIQPPASPSAESFALPKGYSGNAFRHPQAPREEPPLSEGAHQAPEEERDALASGEEGVPRSPALPQGTATSEETQNEGESTPVMGHMEKQGRGLLGRLPFLSSLLPPPRSHNGKEGLLPEWLLIGAVILLFFAEDEGGDILPLLLLLLLWD